jgi:hypothetical protein
MSKDQEYRDKVVRNIQEILSQIPEIRQGRSIVINIENVNITTEALKEIEYVRKPD